MIRATDIHSLTDFTRNAKRYIKEISESKNPIALTVNGDAQVVVQDAKSYQAMVDELEQTRFVRAIRESELDVKEGRVKELGVAISDIRKNVGL